MLGSFPFRDKCSSFNGKEWTKMLTFIILLALLLVLVVVLAIGGAGFVLVFGDLLVFGGLIFLIVKLVKFVRNKI